MDSLPVPGHQLPQISPKAYEHPADAAATAALSRVPQLDRVVRKLIELGYERALRQRFLGDSIRLGPDQLGDVWRAHQSAYAVLDLPAVPDLHLTQVPVSNAAAVGASNPFVVVNSGTLNLLDDVELRTVLAHEAAHLLSDHALYRTATQLVLMLSATALPVGLPVLPIKLALLEWSRASELTCDRGAALVMRDPMAVCRVMLAMSAGIPSHRLNMEPFMRQAMEYTTGGSGMQRLSRLLSDLGVTHPLPVRRVKELLDWVRTGAYDRILSGDYVRRGNEPEDARAHAGAAADHYAERFQTAFNDAGESLNEAVTKLGDWLRGPGPKGPDEPRDA